MSEQQYDVLIAGYGPAGITAAIYAARRKLRVILVGELPGGEVLNSGDIANWPGDGETDGNVLADKLIKHLALHKKDVTVVTSRLTSITKDADQAFTATLESGQAYRGATIIYATGRHPRKLNVPGEDKYKNRGVSYCATCDAPLFPDKEIAVIGGGNSGAEAVIMLQRIAKKIYLLHLGDALKADPILVDNFKNDPKVSVLYQATTKSITGNTLVTALSYRDVKNQKHTLDVQGVFVTIGAIPNTDPVKALGVTLDPYRAVVADRYGLTNVPGFFAAGDVTNIRDAQIVVAAGMGCSAALSAGDYLSRRSAKT